MRLNSFLNRFAAFSFAALLSLGCVTEKPAGPEKPDEKDPTQTEGTTIADVLSAEIG